MKLLRFLGALLCIVSSVFAQSIDYRALGPTYFGSNTIGGVKGIVTGMIGTNAVDGSITNRNQTYGKVSLAGTNAVITSDTGPHDDNYWLFEGRTNSVPTLKVRSDGSFFQGANVSQDVNIEGFGTFFPWAAVTMVDSNEASRMIMQMSVLDSEEYKFYAYHITELDGGKDGSVVYDYWKSRQTNGNSVYLQMIADSGTCNPQFTAQVKDTNNWGFGLNLITLHGLDYTPPLAYGGGTNYVLTDTNGNGTPRILSWQPGLLSTEGTNEIRSLATNVINQNARIGPGTNNVLAKFNVVGGTNVGNSPLVSTTTNLVQQKPRMDGGNFNVASTNQIIGRETSGGDTNWLEFVAGAAGASESHHIRAMATGAASQRLGILFNDAVTIEPIVNQVTGHAAGGMYPQNDAAQTLGTSSQRWQDVWASRMHGTTGLSTGPQFGTGVGGTGFGLTTDNTMLQFFRDTGITAAFNKDRNSGQLMLDIAGNGLGFGSGMSNIIAGFLNSAIVGLVQVGVTNSAVAAPIAQGIMGAQGVGTDKGASDLRLVGGPSTGTGKSGDVRIQTTEPATSTSSSLNSSFKDRMIVASRPVTLTESTATLVFNVALATGKFCGMRVMATTDADDGTDFQSVSETFAVAAVNKAGTVTTSVSASSPMATLTSSGTLTTAWTAVANASTIDVKCNAVSSLTQTTLKVRWRVELDGDGTLVVVPQ